MSDFGIRCRACGTELREVYCAFCEHCPDSLLVSEYREEKFRDSVGQGIWRFNWVPVRRKQESAAGPVVYRSRGLGARLGMENLFIAFNGYWPEMGARMATCTFKELEASVVLANARENGIEGLVVASAGNTARAFAHLSSRTGFPVVIVVPRMCLRDMWYLHPAGTVPTLIIEDGDYSDAIDVAKRTAQVVGMPFEGGVKNVAKRDGLGIVMMEAVATMGMLPDHYVQAVGSGAGAIAAWEMSERFLRDGRFDGRLPRLHLAQNLPFAPMFKAWKDRSRTIAAEDLKPELICEIATRVLSTRYPAYSVGGGVYDALTATEGEMYGVTNDELAAAADFFRDAEGIDIVAAAAVAVSALIQALETGSIDKGARVLLNITGGGEERVRREGKMQKVTGTFISKKAGDEEIERLVCTALKRVC